MFMKTEIYFSSRDHSVFWNPDKELSYFFSECWTRRPNTLSGSWESLCNNCSGNKSLYFFLVRRGFSSDSSVSKTIVVLLFSRFQLSRKTS